MALTANLTSPLRFIVSPGSSSIPARTLWRAGLVVLALTAFIVVRSVNYEFGTVGRYFGYFALQVLLPGVVAMYGINRGRISVAQAIALGIPTGFALEIFTFLACSALEIKGFYPWVPVLWGGAVIAIRSRCGEWPVRIRLSAHHAGVFLGMCLACLATAIMAASQMFAEAPLAAGLPTRAIFHDWVYLVSRAAVIKNNWPLDDPSLAGTPLQYHYFMMVHAAAVSWTTGIELTAVMLRLLYVPMGAVLVLQAFVLGRAVARSVWGGVLAAFLTVVVSELSFAGSYGDPMFLGLFVRWLFVSPTFFFGMIFCGALLIAVWSAWRRDRVDARDYIWLLLLGTAGTGAKGTVLPVMIVALGCWILWSWRHDRRIPVRLIIFGVCLGVAFLVVYIPTMSSWKTGDAAFRPFHVFQLSSFWKAHHSAWNAWLAGWLPPKFALALAGVACGTIVFIGTCGVRMFAIPYLLWVDREKRNAPLVAWVGALFLVSVGIGVMFELNSFGELYVLLMMRLPMAVLTAGFVVAVARQFSVWWNHGSSSVDVGVPVAAADKPLQFRRVLAGGAAVMVAGAILVQTSLWWTRNSSGLREFLRTPADLKPDDYMQELQEALLWVRNNTEPNAVLVANACTPENMKKDHWGALDHTLTGVHFYYSAISERRMWFEGPNYIMDTTRARIRANLASNFFYRDGKLAAETVSTGPTYILLDRSIADGARVSLPPASRVYSNRRIEIYRLHPKHETAAPVEPQKIAGE